MTLTDADRPLLVTCGLCAETLHTTRGRAWEDAMNHALDEHLDHLRNDPDSAGRFLTARSPAATGPQVRELRPVRTDTGWGWA